MHPGGVLVDLNIPPSFQGQYWIRLCHVILIRNGKLCLLLFRKVYVLHGEAVLCFLLDGLQCNMKSLLEQVDAASLFTSPLHLLLHEKLLHFIFQNLFSPMHGCLLAVNWVLRCYRMSSLEQVDWMLLTELLLLLYLLLLLHPNSLFLLKQLLKVWRMALNHGILSLGLQLKNVSNLLLWKRAIVCFEAEQSSNIQLLWEYRFV